MYDRLGGEGLVSGLVVSLLLPRASYGVFSGVW